MNSRIMFLRHLACVLLAVLAVGLGACHKSGGGGDSSSGSATGSAQ